MNTCFYVHRIANSEKHKNCINNNQINPNPAFIGKKTSDFTLTGDTVWGFDLGDGTWTADNFNVNISKYFGTIYAQDFTSAGGARP